MIIFYLIILILILYGIHPRKTEEEKKGYMSKDATNAIKGVFIMMVFLRHANQYVNNSGYDYASIWDKMFVVTDNMLGQLIVVMFLFFSGYGVMSAIQKKGTTYINSIPKHRVLNTLVNFDVAVFFFFLLALFTGRSFTWIQVLLSFLGWEGLGNSNWYIFVILVCYLSTWLSFVSCLKRKKMELCCVVVNSLILVFVVVLLYEAGKQQWWYDTILCYPLGMFYALKKELIERLVCNRKFYFSALFSAISLFFISYLPVCLPNSQETIYMWGGVCFESAFDDCRYYIVNDEV